MAKWAPLHVHSDFSLKDGYGSPQKNAKRCQALGYTACAITDHGTISGAVQFVQACQKVKIKPILGCEFYLSQFDPSVKDGTNRKLSHLVVLAKNLQGWKGLIQATSFANKPEHIYYDRPRLTVEQLANFGSGNFITFSGHMGSDLANVLFKDLKSAYNSRTYEEAKSLLHDNWLERAVALTGKYKQLFGAENFYLEIQLIDHKNTPASVVVAECLRIVSDVTNTPKVATPDAHYPTQEDAPDQRVTIAGAFNTTLNVIQNKLDDGIEVGLGTFFRSNNYHIPSEAEIEALHTPDEIGNALAIADRCENYEILCKQPAVPKFPTPNGMSSIDYLRELCRQGWKKKVVNKVPKERHAEYAERIKHELQVFEDTKILPDYFLIVHDIINWARKRMLTGKGRGSAAGCLTTHLLNVTDIDPVENGLLFTRFYNSGRNTVERVALPDIDMDFPSAMRESVVAYIEEKFGSEYVAQMATFGTYKAKAAMKAVLRAHDACSREEMQRICDYLPDPSSISDKLQEMADAGRDKSTILWTLENLPEDLREWCYIDDNDEFQGPLAKRFEQAIRLEGVRCQRGKHPAGVVISPVPLAEACPMLYDSKLGKLIAGMEMNDLEALGFIKFDILATRYLDKVMDVVSLVNYGEIVSWTKLYG
jgi:DNA polymerase III subunit alpha